VLRKLLTLLALFTFACFAKAAETGKLLPTASLAAEVKQVSSPISEPLELRRSKGLRLQKEISGFVIAQMQSMREISQEQLRAQLQAILCPDSDTSSCDCNQPPYVFSNTWGGRRGTSQFVVAYALYLGFLGPQSSITVLEGYERDNSTGAIRRTAVGGSEFDGYFVDFQMVHQFYRPPEIWVLTWGNVLGASGRGVRGRATVYRVKSEAVEVAWNDAKHDNVTAQRNALGWEVDYGDHDLIYGYDPKPYFFDVYAVNHQKRTFSRIVHHHYAPD